MPSSRWDLGQTRIHQVKVSPIAGFTSPIPSRVVTARPRRRHLTSTRRASNNYSYGDRANINRPYLVGTSTKRRICDVLSRSMPLRRRLYNTRSTSCPGQRIKVGEVILICLPRALDLWRLVTKFVVPDFLGSLCCIREACHVTLGGLVVSSDGPSDV